MRAECKFLIALGTCATAGGIQALRNFAQVEEYARAVYAHPEFLQTLNTSTPISANVPVDLEIWGCPVNKDTVVEVLAALLQNRKPNFPPSPVCLECKRRNFNLCGCCTGYPLPRSCGAWRVWRTLPS